MTASLNEIYRAIGTLSANVQSLGESVKDIKEDVGELRENSETADALRDSIKHTVEASLGRVTKLEETMKSVKAVTDDVTMWKQRGTGILFVTGIAASALTWAVTSWFADIASFFSRKVL